MEVAKKYEDRARFVTIYIKEAHPTDEWQVTSNETEGVCYPQPRTVEDRRSIASDFVKRHKYSIPIFVDDMGNTADALYGAWPERLYIIDTNGIVAYKGEMGPFGFDPAAVEEWLAAHIAPSK